MDAVIGIDTARLELDPHYLEELARTLLGRCGKDADHVELRRGAQRVFPDLAKPRERKHLAAIIGHAATLRLQHLTRDERDVTDARLEMTATEPLAFPASYAEMDDALRSIVVAFCERELEAGRDGPEALANLLRLHGWPYSERTFYVGPWKAARMRRRRRSEED